MADDSTPARQHASGMAQTPSRPGSGGAPLFGLRWVPDSQLRPLRYLPNPNATPTAPSSRQQMRPPQPPPPQTPVAATPGAVPYEPQTREIDTAATHKLQQSVRVLTQRLAEAQESVRQKVEQIRWLKEMTKDDASRARVARWMRGPLLRVFLAWKRCVHDSVRHAFDELQAEHDMHLARRRELEARCDDVSRDHAVLQAALEHYFHQAQKARLRKRLRECWRRWSPLCKFVAAGATHVSRVARGGPMAARGVVEAVRALHTLRAYARAGRQADGLALRASQRLTARVTRSAFGRLHGRLVSAQLAERAEGSAAGALRTRSALRHLWRRSRQRRRLRHTTDMLLPHGTRRALRVAWCAWAAEAVRRLSTQVRVEAARAERAHEELASQLALRRRAEEEARTVQVAASLWGEDELPAMLSNLSKAAESAEHSAAADAAADAAAAGPDGISASEGGAVARRKEAAVAAAGWQGTQLRLTVAALDSLKRELAKERAAVASARAESRASDSVAEQALGMLQALREEGAGMQSKLAQLEEAKLRTEQALVRRDAEIFDLGRAQHQAARTLGQAIAGVEEKSHASLQRLSARIEARSAQLESLQKRVTTMLETRSDRRLDERIRSLSQPLAPTPRGR